MFDELRAAFRQAVVNFREELHRDDPPAMGSSIGAMQREIETASERVTELRRGIEGARIEADREAASLETCLRRRDQARAIGDLETVRISDEYIERHRRRSEILQEKARVLALELAEWEAELARMRAKFTSLQPAGEGPGVA